MQPTWAHAVRGLDRRRGDTPTGFEQNAAAFTAISRWGCQSAYTWGQTPLLHVGLDENKAALPEIDMQATRTIGANGGKEVVTVEANKRILKFTTVACEKNCPTSWSIADANNIPFFEWWSQGRGSEWVIVGLVTVGVVCDGISTLTGKTEMRIGLGSQTDSNVRILWQVEHFDFPVIDLVQFGKWKIGLHWGGGGGIGEKGKLCPRVDKERWNHFVVGVKRPRWDSFLLDGQKLG
jgi:hypothetical protein